MKPIGVKLREVLSSKLNASGRAIAALALCLACIVPAPRADERDAAAWIAASCRGPDGALTVRPHGKTVSGYFGNLTALGLAVTGQRLDVVRDWMTWYLANAHGSGSGIDGVPDDRHIESDGSLTSIGRPDSTDAYGATFMSLALAAYRTGDPELRALIAAHRSELERIAHSALATQQRNGLTYSRPQHAVEYAIDNQQVYRGMLDAADLFSDAFHATTDAGFMRGAAADVNDGIERVLWDPTSQTYRPYVTADGAGKAADLSVAYPDALAQVMAIVYGTVDPKGARAASLLARSSTTLMADDSNSGIEEHRAVLSIALRYAGVAALDIPFSPPETCADAGWYLRYLSMRT